MKDTQQPALCRDEAWEQRLYRLQCYSISVDLAAYRDQENWHLGNVYQRYCVEAQSQDCGLFLLIESVIYL